MRFIRPLFGLLVVGFVAIQVHDANASSTVTTETTKEAYANFSWQSGGLRSSADLVVAENERSSPEGTEHGLHADIELLQVDTRGGHSRMIDVAGAVEIPGGGFNLEADLSGAKVQITIPVCGAKATRKGRLISRPFSECFDVEVMVDWAGVGETFTGSGSDEYQVGACTVRVQSTYQRRPALATGIIQVGAANFADQSISSAISTSRRGTDASCP